MLVTFVRGGMGYRVGFACRDHGRRGDKSWIRDLATQRDDLRLTRMVAVHSSGFSKSTRKVAAAKNIAIFHLKQQALDDVAVEFKMPNEVFAVSIQASAEPTFDVVVEPGDGQLMGSEPHSMKVLISGKPVAMPSLHSNLLSICQHYLLRELRAPTGSSVPCRQSIEVEVAYTLRTDSDVAVVVDDNAHLRCIAFTGQARMSLHLQPMDALKAYSYEDTGVISGEAKCPHGVVTLTYCKRGNRTWLAPLQPPSQAAAPNAPLVFMNGKLIEFRTRVIGASSDGACVLREMLNPTNPSPSAAAARTPRSRS